MSAVRETAPARLRPMVDDDLEAVLAIERAVYPFPWTEGIFRDCLNVGYSCWVGAGEGDLRGYGVMSVAAGESHILNLCVHPDWRRQGLGRTLLVHLLRLARRHRAETALLEVRPSNRGALALYQDLGFSEVGVRRNYYPHRQGREDALILALDLSAGTAAAGLGR